MNRFFRKALLLWVPLALMVGLVPITVPAFAQTTVPGGDVSGTWTASGSPYLIGGDITVPAGQTLNIEPGVEVIFQSWYKLAVNGTLQAAGTESQPILFTGTTKWLGIRFIDAPDGSLLTHVIVEQGQATGASPEDSGGGIYVQNSNPTISYSTLRDNYAKRYGGGIYLTGSNAVLIGNSITNNSAGQGSSAAGGGIYINASNPELTGNIIRGNVVTATSGFTASRGYGGGISANGSNPTLRENVISDNVVNAQEARGGAIYLYNSDPDLINNTITNNTVGEGGGVYSPKEGGGLHLYQSHPVLVNNILWNDTPEEIFFSDNGVGSSITVAYTDLGGGQVGIVTSSNGSVNWLAGNIDADPTFVDPANGDYQLGAGSPAIDAGTPYFEWQGRVLVDLAPGDYVGAAPDMGALEAGGAGGQNQPPVAVAAGDPDHGSAPLSVQFSSAGSYDPDGTIISYAWDFGDGDSSPEANPNHTYTAIGTYQATLTVTDDAGAAHSDVLTIDVMDGTTTWGGDVSGTWTAAGSPYRIEGDITVPAGQTLTIEPGVEVIFESWYKLTVNGTLQAVGTESQPILFTGTTKWLGIRFIDAPDGSQLTSVIIEKGQATGASPEDSGGGIYVQNSNPTISYSTVRDNYAKRYGGGIYLTGSNAALIGNSIINNTAGEGTAGGGGGVYMIDSNPELTGNIIRGNWVYVAGSYTTANGHGGGISANGSNPTLRENVISDNGVEASGSSTSRGGALYLYNSDPDLINNTITNNTVGEGGGIYSPKEGGALYLYQSHPVLVNNILWNDTPEEIYFSDNGVGSSITVAYTDLGGGQVGVVTSGNGSVNWLAGNIDADPTFVDPVNGDYQLASGSPAIDAGTPYFEWQGRVLIDLAPGDYVGAAPDMGALESDNPGGQNQPPVAVALANPTAGDAPLAVQFSSTGSYDPDGIISAYAWDFGDGDSLAAADPNHTYTAAGTYQATLTVTDDAGATDTAAVTVTVDEPAGPELHVGDQIVTREGWRNRTRGVDTVLILDQGGAPASGATVTVSYSGPNSGQLSGTTGSDGTVVLRTPSVRRPQGQWCFEVTDVTKDGYAYNPAANVVTVQCESN